jgi:hypothetical protein
MANKKNAKDCGFYYYASSLDEAQERYFELKDLLWEEGRTVSEFLTEAINAKLNKGFEASAERAAEPSPVHSQPESCKLVDFVEGEYAKQVFAVFTKLCKTELQTTVKQRITQLIEEDIDFESAEVKTTSRKKVWDEIYMALINNGRTPGEALNWINALWKTSIISPDGYRPPKVRNGQYGGYETMDQWREATKRKYGI